MSECPFTPPYPIPHKSKASLIKRFFTGWDSWIHTLFERSYTMKMGEIRLPKLDFFIANDLAVVDRVMNDELREFPKHEFLSDLLDPLIGNSVFSANGQAWEDQRKMVNPAFAHTNLKRSFPMMADAAEHLLAQLRALDLSQPVDIDPLMTHVAADIIFRTLFSVQLSADDAQRIYAAFNRFQKNIQPSAILTLYGLPLFGYRRRAIQAAADVQAVFSPLVRARYDAWRAGTAPAQPDILQSLLEARHPQTGAPFTFEELIGQISTIFLAGHETSASAMSWAFYLLSECPGLQDKLVKEIEATTLGTPMQFESLRQMEGVRNLFRETLRLYPPVSFFVRAVTEPTVIRDKTLRRGAMVVISPWLIQRNVNNWSCPHQFDPERFSKPESAELAKTAWLPFGKGPRICIGAGFAQQEATLVIASVIRAFRLHYPEGPKPEPISRLTLRPKHGIRLQLSPRAGRDA